MGVHEFLRAARRESDTVQPGNAGAIMFRDSIVSPLTPRLRSRLTGRRKFYTRNPVRHINDADAMLIPGLSVGLQWFVKACRRATPVQFVFINAAIVQLWYYWFTGRCSPAPARMSMSQKGQT
jgi:hypothetical protein